jgi:hypothetical protein
MKILYTCLGPVVFTLLFINFICQYGSRWEFGRLAMPAVLLDASGTAYRDGTMIDPITLAIAQSGKEQEAWIVAVGVVMALLIWAAISIGRTHPDYQRSEDTRPERGQFCGQPNDNPVT